VAETGEIASAADKGETAREGVGDVLVPLVSGKAGLWRPASPAAEDSPDRAPKATRQVVGLIEPALDRAPWVKRHWNHRIGRVDRLGRRRAQE
jgi:hypothetical protein